MERARVHRLPKTVRDPERVHALESLRLARTELERQLAATANERRRAQLQQAIEEVGRRMTETSALTSQ
jgi:hypothetical protein